MPNAIDLLREDHQKVKDLFEHFEEMESGDKRDIVATTLHELEIHTAVEEEIFYPAARKALEETDEETNLIDEAWEEHHVVKLLAAELKKMRASDKRYDAKFTVLAESVKHHIEEEEHGFSEVYALAGGFDAWRTAGNPVETKVRDNNEVEAEI